MQSEKENINSKEQIRRYQINRAKDYLKNNTPKDGSEPTLEWCIISDLLRILKG
jgi:hypothetical protein